MNIGTLDLSPCEYMIVYKQDDKINTWTLPEGSFRVNYKQMKNDKTVEIISVYKMLCAEDILDVMLK